MEVVIPLAIVILVACLATKRFAPDNWDIMVSNVKRIVSKFKKQNIVMAAKPRPTTADVAANLHAHEVKCEERWKTIFSETADIKQEMAGINQTIRMATFGLFGFIGTLLIALLSGILPIN